MLRRNDFRWRSVAKLSILSITASFVLIASSAQAQWNLIDDFEGLTAGDLVDGTTGAGATWDGASIHTAEVDPSDAGNLALQVLGTTPNNVLRGQFNSAGSVIADGDTGTLYYRFRTPDASAGTTDTVIGLTDNATIGNFNFKSGLRNTIDATGTFAANNMDARQTTDGYEQVSLLADNSWYSLWMVSANTSPGGSFELYLQSDTDAAFATQTKLASTSRDVFDYRIDAPSDIINVYIRTAANAGGTVDSTLYFDDIWMNGSAADLSVPGGSVGGLACDAEPDGDCDIDDLDALYAVFGAAGANGPFDFDADGDVDTSDISAWLTAASVPSNTALHSPTDQLALGDINFDGNVDSSDLGLMLNNFGDTSGLGWSGGDLDGDMNVTSTDLGLLLNSFGFASPAAASAVPEPASALLLLLAMVGLFAARKRSRVCVGR